MAALEEKGAVRLYHARQAGYWVCAVHKDDWGSRSLHAATGETPEDAIDRCMIEAGVGPHAEALEKWITARDRLNEQIAKRRRILLLQRHSDNA